MATLIFGETTIGAEEFSSRVARIAGGLDRLGVGDGDVVALMLRNEPVFVEVMLAVRAIGAYFCPINWHFKADEAGHILRDTDAKFLVVHADLLAQIGGAVPAGVQVFVVTPLPQTRAAFGIDAEAWPLPACSIGWASWLSAQRSYDGPARRARGNMPYTSGTTGRPKGVRRDPVAAENAAVILAAQGELNRRGFGIAPGMRTLIAAPMYHSAPNLVAMQAGLNDATMVIEPRFDAERTLMQIEAHRLDHVYLVPTLMVRLLKLPDDVRRRYDLSSMRYVSCMGSFCPPEVKARMLDWWGPVIFEAYAASELGLITVITPQEARSKPGSVGRPAGTAAGNAIVRILDDEGLEAPVGTVGTIYCRQPAVPDFTYNNDDAARRSLERDGLWTVGDMGYVDADGYLFICDRASDMVISGGVNIYPAEIEQALIAMPEVADCAIFGIPDPEFGESLAAAVQLREGQQADAGDVQRFLAQRIADYKVPRLVEFHAALPREETGKIFKRRLRDPHWANAGRRI
jgi:long-chain acyl-CoA synthetase